MTPGEVTRAILDEVRDRDEKRVSIFVSALAGCSCPEPIVDSRHVVGTAQIFQETYDEQELAGMLAVAVTRLAIVERAR